MSNQQYFCFGCMDILESGFVIGIMSVIMDAICAFIDFSEVINSMRLKIPMSQAMTLFYIGALTVYVGAFFQNIMICCASYVNDLNKFFDTYNGVSFLFCVFAFFDGIFYRERTELMIFFLFCAALNVYFLTATCTLKEEMKRDQQRTEQEAGIQHAAEVCEALHFGSDRVGDGEMAKFAVQLNSQKVVFEV